MGRTTTYLKVVGTTPTISTSAYASGDQLGGVMTITDALRHEAERSVIRSISVVDLSGKSTVLDVLFFSSPPTVPGDNLPMVMDNTELMNFFLGAVRIDNYIDTGTQAVATVAPIEIILQGTDQNVRKTDIYAVAVVRDVVTYSTTTDLTFKFGIHLN